MPFLSLQLAQLDAWPSVRHWPSGDQHHRGRPLPISVALSPQTQGHPSHQEAEEDAPREGSGEAAVHGLQCPQDALDAGANGCIVSRGFGYPRTFYSIGKPILFDNDVPDPNYFTGIIQQHINATLIVHVIVYLCNLN